MTHLLVAVRVPPPGCCGPPGGLRGGWSFQKVSATAATLVLLLWTSANSPKKQKYTTTHARCSSYTSEEARSSSMAASAPPPCQDNVQKAFQMPSPVCFQCSIGGSSALGQASPRHAKGVTGLIYAHPFVVVAVGLLDIVAAAACKQEHLLLF